LERAGYEVWTAESMGDAERAGELPDICLTHGHPYDTRNAPGRVNVFFLEYDYARFTRGDRFLKENLEGRFDLCLAPSRFVRDACLKSGLGIPVAVCPLGVDLDELCPSAPPVPLPTEKRFRFVHAGSATERKGVDVLVEAYRAEFESGDDVVLILKTFGYDHLLPWLEEVLHGGATNGPEIVHLRRPEPSLAGYYTAADVGVFPFRGEGFALPILECLAAGTPVIVTRGGGPADYCRADNAAFLRARWSAVDGKIQLEPDLSHLRRLMRAAYERRGQGRDREAIRASVAHLTWDRTVAAVAEAIEGCFGRVRPVVTAKPAAIVHAHGPLGRTSWRKVGAEVDAALRARCGTVRSGALGTIPATPPGVVVAQSGFALEHFAAAERSGAQVEKILVRGSGPFDFVAELVSRERELAGLEPIQRSAMERWRNRQEERLADILLVHSHATARRFMAQGRSAETVRVVPLGFTRSRSRPRPRLRGQGEGLRFLFLGTDPFRKGIRVLLAAWDRLRPRHAELLCLVDTEVLRSQSVLRCLVRNPSITVKPLVAHAELAREYDRADCQVLPSLEDGFALAIADGMGRGLPAIVSTETGISELLSDGRDGLIVEAGSIEALHGAIERVCDDRRALAQMGAEAFATARRRPWSLFRREVGDIVAGLRGAEAP
jgi:glycosyltransferase involved in cell wall biosynthesis